jgi:Domain of unknown function (DUF4760)
VVDGLELAEEPEPRHDRHMELKPGYLAATAAIALLAFSLGLWIGRLPITTLEEAAKLAPLGTAIIASCAAVIAAIAVFIQRDTAKRRASIDFFLKTETDDGLISAYNKFRALIPKIPVIIARPTLSEADEDYQTLRKWLNLCELIAVGVNLGAFSDKVSYDYWGYVLSDTFNDSKHFIEHIRRTPGLGGPMTFCDLEKLSNRWSKKSS